MTTYRAIGKYRLDATDDEKIRALCETIRDAAVELATLGITVDLIENEFEEALRCAEDEWASLPLPRPKETT